MTPRALIVPILLCFALNAFAKPGVVRTKDGRAIEGDVTDKGADGATVATRAGSITIAREDIASIDLAGNIKEVYQQRVAKLSKDASAKDHFALARWLYDNKEYELARNECDTALRIDPNYAEAATLRATVDRNITWANSGRSGNGKGTDANASTAGNPGVKPGSVRDRKLLDNDQINTIRQYEMRENETRVPVRLENNVARRFVEFDNRDSREFAALTMNSQALAILQKGSSEMRRDVRINGDPQALAEFKTRVQPTLLQGCSATGCHSKPDGKFVMYSPASNNETTYTNFYILTKYVARSVDGADRKLVDRLYPRNSLVLQYGLPRNVAEFDHPEVQGWTPTFSSVSDVRYLQVLNWIGQTLVPVEPKYKLDYTLPGKTEDSATQPAVKVEEVRKEEVKGNEVKREEIRREERRPVQNGNRSENPQPNPIDPLRSRLRPVGIN